MGKKILILLGCSLFFTACSTLSTEQDLNPTLTLKPYSSATPTSQVTRLVFTPAPLPTEEATATQWVHKVETNDTLSGIAARYGVELADLLAANPAIDPQFLSLDMEIIIPVEGSSLEDTLSSTATPVPVPVRDPVCYQTFGNELWCITGIENDSGQEMEGLSVLLTIYNGLGEILSSEIIYSPVNLLPENRIMPMAASFDWAEVDTYAGAKAVLTSGFQASQVDERYASVEVENINIVFSENRTRAAWKGSLVINSDQDDRVVRPSVLLIALDSSGALVGYRKIDLEEDTNGSLELEAQVYSFGPEITRIEILAEALYVPES